MKILLVHNFYKIRAGEHSVFQNEMNLLKDNNHNVITYHKDNKNINSFFSKLDSFLNIVFSKKIYKEFNELLKKEKPDIIHVHNFFPLITPSVFFAAYDNKIPIIQTLHNYRHICPSAILMHKNKIYEKSITSGVFSTVFDKVYKNSYLGTFALAKMINYHKKKNTWNSKVNKFIALTHFSKSKFEEAGFLSHKISVKPNFVFDIKKDDIKKEKFGLFVGRIGEEKGIKILIEAWKNINYPLIIAGSGPLENELKCLNQKNINFIGNQDKKKIIELMNSATFLVIPSIWYEGFPMVILEAYSAGLPVIGSKIGSVGEVVNDNITGLHFEPNNSKDLSDKVNKLINNDSLLEKLSFNAREEYLNKFIPQKNYNELIHIYNEVINDCAT
tara:strand:- start:1538 stop:2698 length:1161 start_codon:yes stop_codon:yes gene_type:complete